MNGASPATAKLLTLSMLKGIGPSALKAVINDPSFPNASISELGNRSPKLAKALEASPDALEKAQEEASRQIELATKAKDWILSPWDDDFPALLLATPDGPFFLYVRGRLSTTPERSVAIIGTREPTEHGKLTAQRITAWCVEQGLSVVSGLALGCDGIAHRQALDSGGHTVAVLAHGLHTIAPSSHRKLAADILENGGALVSEFAYGTPPVGPQFVKRDRTQAGLAQGVVMIQSDLKGGSLHASRASLQYGRWLAVPAPTNRDDTADEPKIQANRLIASTNSEIVRSFLKCRISDLHRITVLRGREDYAHLLTWASALSGGPHMLPMQNTLL